MKSNTILPHAHFAYRGSWPLSKPTCDPLACWQISLVWQGKRVRRSLGFPGLKDAKVRAKTFVDAFLLGILAPVAVPAPVCATVGDVAAAFSHLTIAASPKTRHEYLGNLRRCLVHALDPVPPDLASVRLDELTDVAGARLFAWVETAALAEVGQVAQNRLRGSWLSMFNTGLALFAKRALYQLRARGLVIPDLTGWREAALNHGPKLPPASGADVPDDGTCRRLRLEWLRLGLTPGYVCRNHDYRQREGGKTSFVRGPLSEVARRNMFLAAGLELSCGLRKGDAPKARWGWIKEFSGVPHLSELSVDVKNRTGRVHVVPVDPYWRVMLWVARRNGWMGGPEDSWLIVPEKRPGEHAHLDYDTGGASHATAYPFDHIGWLLRDLGFATQKTNHALRDYTASVITMRYGLEAACDWCRHSDPKTTRKSYNRFVTLAGKVNKRKYAWLRWAR